MSVVPDFWRGRRVLVTGHTGFKGAWLSLWLQRMGAEVFGFARSPTAPSLFRLADVGVGMTQSFGDLRDLEAVTAAVRDARPEVVFHLAAQSLVRASYADPVGTFSTNVMGTAHLLEAVLRANAEWKGDGGATTGAVVVVTTDKCYENKERLLGYREDESLGGRDPYSSSKACAELVTAAFRASFAADVPALGIATARAGNVIGGGDWAQDRLLPDAIAAFERGEVLRVRNPGAIRPWQHVLEPLAGYLLLAQQLVQGGTPYAEAWNFGPDAANEKSVGDVVSLLAELWGGMPRWESDAGPHPHEAQYLKLDSSKARTRLDWRPRLSLVDALQLTVDWHRARRASASPREVTLNQIASYCQS